MTRREFAEKKMREQELWNELFDLRSECVDEGVEKFFDLSSNKMLGKKVGVLRALNSGKSPDEIGKDYYDILENLHVPEGQMIEVGGQILDPHKYDE